MDVVLEAFLEVLKVLLVWKIEVVLLMCAYRDVFYIHSAKSVHLKGKVDCVD